MRVLNIAQIICLIIITGVVRILAKGIDSPLFWIVMGTVALYGFLSWFEGKHESV